MPVSGSFLWATVGAAPAATINPDIMTRTVRQDARNRNPATILTPRDWRSCIHTFIRLAVAINLSFVKRRRLLRRCAPQRVARFARADESSALELSTTFTLRAESVKIWWASLRLSVRCREFVGPT